MNVPPKSISLTVNDFVRKTKIAIFVFSLSEQAQDDLFRSSLRETLSNTSLTYKRTKSTTLDIMFDLSISTNVDYVEMESLTQSHTGEDRSNMMSSLPGF